MSVCLAALDLTVRELGHLRAAVGGPVEVVLHKLGVHRERTRGGTEEGDSPGEQLVVCVR